MKQREVVRGEHELLRHEGADGVGQADQVAALRGANGVIEDAAEHVAVHAVEQLEDLLVLREHRQRVAQPFEQVGPLFDLFLERVEEQLADQAAGLFDLSAEQLLHARSGLLHLAAGDRAGELELRRRLARADERLEQDRRRARRPLALGDLVGVVAERDAVERVREFERRARLAGRSARALAQAGQQVIDGLDGRRELGVGEADVQQAVVVAAGGARLVPRLGPARPQIVNGREALDFPRRQPIEHRLERLAVVLHVRAVQALEALEKQQQPLKVPPLELVVLAVDRVGDAVGDPPRLDVGGNVVDVARERLQLGVLLAVDAVDEQVELAVVLGEPAGEFFADEHVRPIGDRQHALDRVVIGDRDEVHAAQARLLGDVLGPGIALRTADRVERLFGRLRAREAVAVQVDALGRRPGERVGCGGRVIVHAIAMLAGRRFGGERKLRATLIGGRSDRTAVGLIDPGSIVSWA